MKKTLTVMLAALILAYNCTAQPVGMPEQGQGVDLLIQAIYNNTLKSENTAQKVDNLYTHINQQMTYWISTVILGISIFIVIIELFKAIVSRQNRIRKKRQYEAYILQIEDREKEIIQKNEAILSKFNQRIDELTAKYDKLYEQIAPTPFNFNLKNTWVKGFLTATLMLALLKILGWI